MITITKNYTNINIKIRNMSVADSKPPSLELLPKVYSLNFGMIHCLFRYSADAGYIKLLVGIQSVAPEAARRNFLFSSFFTKLLVFSFGSGPTSACRLPSVICSSPRQEGVKAAVD